MITDERQQEKAVREMASIPSRETPPRKGNPPLHLKLMSGKRLRDVRDFYDISVRILGVNVFSTIPKELLGTFPFYAGGRIVITESDNDNFDFQITIPLR